MPAVTVTSDTEICNLALSDLGHFEITAMSENTKAARLCRRFYVPVRNALMRARNWNTVTKRLDLAQSSTTPPFEYTYQYALPSDCVKVIRTELEALGCTDGYRIEGGNLLSNESEVAIEYLAAIEDVSLYDALFVQVFSKQLAIAMCMGMTDNASLKKTLGEELRDMLPTASTIDAQEGTPRDQIFDTWLNARV